MHLYHILHIVYNKALGQKMILTLQHCLIVVYYRRKLLYCRIWRQNDQLTE